MRQRILSLGIRLRVLIVTFGGLLMLSGPVKAESIQRDNSNKGVNRLNQKLGIDNLSSLKDQRVIFGLYKNSAGQTIGLLGAATPEPSSLALVGLGALLVALGYKRRRS
jgi:hypothetical protein